MYTYDTFEISGAFTLLRPTLITILIILLLALLLIVFTKKATKFFTQFSMITISIFSIILSGQLLFYIAIITDELGLNGDSLSTYLFLAIIGLATANPIIFHYKNSRKTIVI